VVYAGRLTMIREPNVHADDANQDNVYECVQFHCVHEDVNVSDFYHYHPHEYDYDDYHHDYANEREPSPYGNVHACVRINS